MGESKTCDEHGGFFQEVSLRVAARHLVEVVVLYEFGWGLLQL